MEPVDEYLKKQVRAPVLTHSPWLGFNQEMYAKFSALMVNGSSSNPAISQELHRPGAPKIALKGKHCTMEDN